MKRNAKAVWKGSIKRQRPSHHAERDARETQYSSRAGLKTEPGPSRELMAAAHAGCFTMKLSAELRPPVSYRTR